MRILRVWLFASGALGLPALLSAANEPPLSADFLVNTYTTGGQYSLAGASVAINPTGSFVVVWDSYGQDGSKDGIFGQRFNGAGRRTGSEFQVNSYTTNYQGNASVAIDSDGRFVVVWTSDGQDGSGTGVFGQRFDGSGAKLGSEFQVNTDTTGAQNASSVAADEAGEFVVVWVGAEGSYGGVGILGQRFDGSGVKVGSEFQVDGGAGTLRKRPSIAMNRGGAFVVAWTAPDGNDTGIFGQRFNSSGAKVGPEFQVNTYTTGAQDYPRVALDHRGNFVVVWQGPALNAGLGVFVQRFNSSGEKVGSEFEANSYWTGDQTLPSVAVDDAGNFVVAWTSAGGVGENGYSQGVFAQRFNRSGELLDTNVEFKVNSYTTGVQSHSSVAVDPGGNMVIVWEGEGQGDDMGVFGRRSNVSPVAMQVDAHAGAGSTSDVNGILSAGETVVVSPTWKNLTSSGGIISIPLALSGTASNFYGPGVVTYTIEDSFADDGLVPSGGTSNCYDGTIDHDCYLLHMSAYPTRSQTHWDTYFNETLSTGGLKQWTLHVGDSFTDVPGSQPFYRKVETLLHHGITSGCTEVAYCPGIPVGRDQMSIFIAKAMAGSGELVPTTGEVSGAAYDCSSGGASLFTDVSPTDSFCRHVHYLAAQNVTLGCSPGQYCPSQTITRDAMAAFIAKAVVAPSGGNAVPLTYGPDPNTGRSYSCAAGSPNLHFSDVPASNGFCKHVHYLWAKGIVDGCSASEYCPGAPVNRDAMAKFIVNGFGLQLYGP